jgi:large subunit ribosomal protein L1
VHVPIGKVSFGREKLEDNALAVLASLNRAKPSTSKGNYMVSVGLSSTMGPGVKVSSVAARAAA